AWFELYDWLEYSISKEAAYCLPCCLFRNHDNGKKAKKEYRIRLEASFECINWLLKHGLPFRGHDESKESNNRGLFLSLLEFYASDIEHVKSVVLENAPKNQQMTSPDIQKDIVHALAIETTKLITTDIGGDFFAILADESRDVSVKEQMGVVLRYVDGKGCVIERFLAAIESMLMKNGLSISRVRGQGYDGASNMKGEINGLKTLILEESPSAYYIHCFAHRLGTVTNLVGASCKRQDIIKETQQNKDQDIVNAIHLVNASKRRLQELRDNGWDALFQETIKFCIEESIEVPNSSDIYVCCGKSKRIRERVTCLHHFLNCQLLLSMACLNPHDSFVAFDKEKLMQLATFYPNEFPPSLMKFLGHQLNSYICDLPFDNRFKDLKGVDELAKKMVETNKHKLYPPIYFLIKLTLILPVATASVERAFSSMKYVKNDLRNRMNDEWLNDALVTYIEQDLCASLDKECVLQCFQSMKSRRGSLSTVSDDYCSFIVRILSIMLFTINSIWS
ncbi:Zinc finger MYM-type protein 1, partial [Linum perenne]